MLYIRSAVGHSAYEKISHFLVLHKFSAARIPDSDCASCGLCKSPFPMTCNLTKHAEMQVCTSIKRVRMCRPGFELLYLAPHLGCLLPVLVNQPLILRYLVILLL